MSCVVYQRSKNGSTYAYRSESYRDPRSGKPRSRREYLGRVDPETGEIIPKRQRRRRAAGEAAEPHPGTPGLEAALDRVAALEARNRRLEASVDELVGALSELRGMIAGLDGAIGRAIDAAAVESEPIA